MMLADVLEEAGIPRGDFVIKVNNRKVLNGILEIMGLTDQVQRDAVLRTIDKFDKVGEAGVLDLLGKGRKIVRGYTNGVGLSSSQADPVMAFLTSKGQDTEETLANLRAAVGTSTVGRSGVDELETMAVLFQAAGYAVQQIDIDPSVVRGLGIIQACFEAELTFEIFDEEGRKRQFGSVAGGGRYDDLVKRFTGQEVPATGVSIGIDRLLAALGEKGHISSTSVGPVIVTVMDRIEWRIIRPWSVNYAQRVFAPKFILAIPKILATNSSMRICVTPPSR